MAEIVKRPTPKTAKEEKVKETKKAPKKEDVEKSPIECLLDEENSEDIVLYDEKNKKTVFEQVAVIPMQNKIYAILKPAEKILGIEDDQALVFVIEEIDGEDCLRLVEDDKTIDDAFEQYYELLRKEGLMK